MATAAVPATVCQAPSFASTGKAFAAVSLVRVSRGPCVDGADYAASIPRFLCVHSLTSGVSMVVTMHQTSFTSNWLNNILRAPMSFF